MRISVPLFIFLEVIMPSACGASVFVSKDTKISKDTCIQVLPIFLDSDLIAYQLLCYV